MMGDRKFFIQMTISDFYDLYFIVGPLCPLDSPSLARDCRGYPTLDGDFGGCQDPGISW